MTNNFFIDVLTAIGQGLEAVQKEQEKHQDNGLTIDAKNVGQLIRLARAQRDMSLRDLSRLTDISDLKLRWYEEDGDFWKPSFDELITIKKALGISAASVRPFL